jgi:integrative and conjugative element protein (TIGR02256 family)
MRRLAGEHAPREVGTALVGSYSDDGREATILGLAPITPDSRGARFTFHRGTRGLVSFFVDLFRRSKGLSHYVGEWHSHPGGAPSPSGTDDENMLAIARDPMAKCPECVLLILATGQDRAELGAFVYSRIRGRTPLSRAAPASEP